VLLKQKITPIAFARTRMLQFAPLYQRFRFRKIRFLYEPVAPTTTAGQLIGFCDFDVNSELPTESEANWNRAAAHEGQVTNQVWEPAAYEMQQDPGFTDLFISPQGDDPRLEVQGEFYLIAATEFPAEVIAGNILIEYELDLVIPQLAGGLGTCAQNTGLIPDATYTNLFGSEITRDPVGGLDVVRLDGSTVKILGIPEGWRVRFDYYASFGNAGSTTRGNTAIDVNGADVLLSYGATAGYGAGYQVFAGMDLEALAGAMIQIELSQAVYASGSLQETFWSAVAYDPLVSRAARTRKLNRRLEALLREIDQEKARHATQLDIEDLAGPAPRRARPPFDRASHPPGREVAAAGHVDVVSESDIPPDLREHSVELCGRAKYYLPQASQGARVCPVSGTSDCPAFLAREMRCLGGRVADPRASSAAMGDLADLAIVVGRGPGEGSVDSAPGAPKAGPPRHTC
jgi:hypothetical protein